MKRFVSILVLAAVLAALLASTALAAGPVFGRWAQQGNPSNTPGACPAGGTCAATGTTCPMGGAGMMAGGMMGGAGRPAWAGQPDEVETLLGMTDAQIQAERQAGKSLAQIAASKGVAEAKLIETILAAKKADLQQAVAGGKLTQAQADLMVKNMETMVKTMVERTTTGPMMGQGNDSGRWTPGAEMRGGGMRGGGMRGQRMQGVPGGSTF